MDPDPTLSARQGGADPDAGPCAHVGGSGGEPAQSTRQPRPHAGRPGHAGRRRAGPPDVPQQRRPGPRRRGPWPGRPPGRRRRSYVRLAFIVLAAASGAGVVAYGLFWVFAPQDALRAGRTPRSRERDLTHAAGAGLADGRRRCCCCPPSALGFRPGLAAAAGRRRRRRGDPVAAGRRRRPRTLAAGDRRRTGFPARARAADRHRPRRHRRRRDPGRPGPVGRHPRWAGRRRRRGARARPGERPVVGADGPRPGRGAQRAHPRAGARRGRRARARLGPAHPDPDPAPRRRPARGQPAGPRPGARAARLALPADRRRPGRHGSRGRPGGGARPRSRTRTASPSRWSSSATARSTSSWRAVPTRRARRWSTPRSTPADAAISVYAEVEPEQVTVFVRDRGPGFDPDAVPEDRLGLRQSVIGRMERHGGTADGPVGPRRGHRGRARDAEPIPNATGAPT